jgi:hypothetical protein
MMMLHGFAALGCAGYDHPAFALVLKLVDKGRAWVRLSGAYRDNQDVP